MKIGMIVGLIGIAAGLAIAQVNSVVDGNPADPSHPAAVSWQLNLIGVMGLLLASQGCRKTAGMCGAGARVGPGRPAACHPGYVSDCENYR